MLLLRFAPLLVIVTGLSAWEATSRADADFNFLFSSPVEVVWTFVSDLSTGTLMLDIGITFAEAVLGLLIGGSAGILIGLTLALCCGGRVLAGSVVTVLGSVPIIAIAPMTIIWFGTDMDAKIVLAALATVFVAISQAYAGALAAMNTAERWRILYRLNFQRVILLLLLPGSITWVLSAYRLNIGFALLGAFVGEFISSQAGVGHYIIRASGLYDVPRVLSGVLAIMLMSLVLFFIVGFAEKRWAPWLGSANTRQFG